MSSNPQIDHLSRSAAEDSAEPKSSEEWVVEFALLRYSPLLGRSGRAWEESF